MVGLMIPMEHRERTEANEGAFPTILLHGYPGPSKSLF